MKKEWFRELNRELVRWLDRALGNAKLETRRMYYGKN